MDPIHIMKVNITMNLLKIISIWGATIVLVFQMGTMFQEFKTKLTTYDVAVQDVKDLKNWKQKVEAYYYPAKRIPEQHGTTE